MFGVTLNARFKDCSRFRERPFVEFGPPFLELPLCFLNQHRRPPRFMLARAGAAKQASPNPIANAARRCIILPSSAVFHSGFLLTMYRQRCQSFRELLGPVPPQGKAGRWMIGEVVPLAAAHRP